MIERLGWVLIHFLWQGTAVAAMLWLTLSALRGRSASARYAACCAAMLLMSAAPALTFFTTAGADSASARAGLLPASTSTPSPGLDADAPAAASAEGMVTARFSQWFPALVSFWSAGVCVLLVRLAGGLMVAHRLRSRGISPVPGAWQARASALAARIRVSRAVRLYESALVEVPTVVGWLKPVILVPASALTQLTPAQLEALLAHELAHIRRHDYLVNLLHAAVETLLFYHPAVWWTGRRIREERENCCDDVAVAICGNPVAYARALSRLEEVRGMFRPQLALAADGGSLVARVRRLLMSPQPESTRSGAGWLAAALATVAVVSAWSGATAFASRRVPSLLTPGVGSLLSQTPAPSTSGPVSSAQSAAPRLAQDGKSPKPSPFASPAPEFAPGPSGDSQPVLADSPSGGNDPQDGDDADDETDSDESEDEQEQPRPPAQSPSNSFINGLEAAGLKNLSVDQLIAFKIHGVNGQYIQQMKAAGFNASPEQLLAMRIHGVTPEFAQEMKSAGYPNLPIDKLLACRIHGVNPKTVTEIRQLGFSNLSIDDVLAARIHGVTADSIRGLKAAGLNNLTFDNVVSARIHGVSPELVQSLRNSGFPEVDFDDAVSARIHGVTPAFITKVKGMGFKNLTFDKLVQLKQFGIVE